MPKTDLHKKKLKKNLVILALVLAWCALIWAVTMVKLAHADDRPHDISKSYHTQRTAHQAALDAEAVTIRERGAQHESVRQAAFDNMTQQGRTHIEAQKAERAAWENAYRDSAAARARAVEGRDNDRARHQAAINKQPESWWQGWRNRLIPE